MVFKDDAGTMQAQIDHANQEKKVLFALQNINIANKNFDTALKPEPVAKASAPLKTTAAAPAPPPAPTELPPHFTYKPQGMHCLKKLLEQNYEDDYIVPTYLPYVAGLQDVLSAYMAGEYHYQLAEEQIKKDLKAQLKSYIKFQDDPDTESEQEEVEDNGSMTSSSDDEEDSSEDEDAIKPAPQIDINII